MGSFSTSSVSPDDSVRGLLGLLQLGRRVREAADLEELGFVIVNETRSLLHYRQAALWLGGGAERVAAVSGVPAVDPGAPFQQWLVRMFRALGPLDAPRRLQADELSPLLAEEWGAWLPAHALCVPLMHARLATPGVLVLARDEAWDDGELGLASELGPLFGHALHALQPRRRLAVRLRHGLRSRRVWWRVGLALVLVSAIPVRLSTLASADITPVHPFVVRSPLAGVIDRLQVRPNQPVKAGSPLFDLDATTLTGRYASARKAYQAALQQYRQIAQQAVTDDKSRLQLAERRGDMELKRIDMQYAGKQLARVQVKAPHAGVAVFEDVNDWTGKAVQVGEKVMMLADPGRVEVTAYMPVGSQVDLAPGAHVVFYPQAAPFTSYTATVKTVAYRARPTDQGVLAYRVRATLDAHQRLPRLGLSGTARLYAGRVPLIYDMLRRPLSALRQWLGW